MDALPSAVAQQLWALLTPWLSLGLPSPPAYYDVARGQVQAGNTASGSQAPPPTSQLSAEEHRAAGMIAVNATLEAARAPETVRRREKVAAEELRQWLLVYGQGRTLADCTPLDVLLFMETWWIPHHSGSMLRSGVKVAAPQTIATNLSHLSTLFQLNGRACAYHERDNPLGNPREGFLASHWMTGKRKQLFRAGYEEGSTVPLSLNKVTQVLMRLDSLAATEGIRPLDRLCHLRDGLCFNFCWVTGQRGDDAGKLTLDDLWCDDQGLRLMQPMPIPAAGQVLLVSCRGSKTHQNSRLKPFDLAATPCWTTPPAWLTSCPRACALGTQ